MSKPPLLSYIVLSYNYERYIVHALQSIFDQSVQDFEVVVVDDGSTDRSIEIVSSFNDSRIRLLRNSANVGGAASYNRAVEAARGEWLVNLDADDWIAPTKAELQLSAVRDDPGVDVVGTYVAVVDENDAPHSSAAALQSTLNRPYNFNVADTWIGTNHLCRSSTMVRASAHRRIGLDDPDMVRAPDYELWTRALREGVQIKVVPQELTFMRTHSRGVTHADPAGSFLEMSFAMLRNLVPHCEALALYPSYSRIVTWVGQNLALSSLLPYEAFRLIGMFLQAASVSSFVEFQALLRNRDEQPYLADLGRRALTLANLGAAPYQETSKLRRDVELFVEARDYWHDQSDRWEQLYRSKESVGLAPARVVRHLRRGLLRRVQRKLVR
jgi:glycosyltransferase involved in cell wall biosynthesis